MVNYNQLTPPHYDQLWPTTTNYDNYANYGRLWRGWCQGVVVVQVGARARGSSAGARTSVFFSALPSAVYHQPVFALKQGFQICFDHKIIFS